MGITEQQILERARSAFLEEAQDLLAELESALLSLHEQPQAEGLNAAFRAAHTIKGSAGLFGMTAVVAFTHQVEALLDRMREGRAPCDEPVAQLLLECRDHIASLLAEADGEGDAAAVARRGEALQARLQGVAAAGMGPAAAPAGPAPAADHGPAPAGTPNGAPVDWLLQARFRGETFRSGFDPLSFLRYLPTLGEVIATEALLDEIPTLDDLDPEACHLGAVMRLSSRADKRQIEAVFDFVAEHTELTLLPGPRPLEAMSALLAQQGDEQARIGELLVRVGALTERELAGVLAQRQHASAQAGEPLPAIGRQIVQQRLAPAAIVEAAAEHQGRLRAQRGDETRFVRVQADKLDALIALVGELVIAGSATQILATAQGDAALGASAARVASLLESARDRVLQLRMVPIGETFARFRRIAHEVGQSLGKEVELSITGGDAELDKSMVDRIVDPLTHLVRNALDHGLESPAERLAAGKPPRGRLCLHAVHESGAIVIEVSDDGRGLRHERILAKAIERGLVPPGAELTESQVCDLIFQPGFSTAEAVTDLSGRGVGLDVVRRNIEALRGEVSVRSRPGEGSTVCIRLPLTLAIIDGFRFDLGVQAYVVPLDAVVECVELPRQAAAPGGGCFLLRGEVLPLLDLRALLRLPPPWPPQSSVLVLRCGARKVGLPVDRLIGEHQTVIKPLGRLLRHMRGVSGSTILGTGAVALILELPALLEMADLAARPTSSNEPTRSTA